MMELAPKMHSKFLFLLIDPITTLLIVTKNPKIEEILMNEKMDYSAEKVLYHVINYMLALLNYNFVSQVKLILTHNSVNINNLCRRANMFPTIKREAVVMKINSLYVEVGKISSIHADKQRQIVKLLDESLESFVEGEMQMNQLE